jgi:hypothetical protein
VFSAISEFAIANPTLVAFLGGGVTAWGLGLFVTHWILHPVIGVHLDEKKGSYGPVPLYKQDKDGNQTHSHDGRYLRLYVENTGLSSVKDCCGFITKITKSTNKGETTPRSEVLDLGWSHHGHSRTRSIPRGTFFHMDVVTLHLLPQGRELRLPGLFPTTLRDFFAEKATYKFEVTIAADNAAPRRGIPVELTFDPEQDDLTFKPVNRARYPWWRLASRASDVSYWSASMATQNNKPPESSVVRRLSALLDALQRRTPLHRILERHGLNEWKDGEPRGHFDVIVDRYALLFAMAALIIYPFTVYWKPFSERANFMLAVVVVCLSALRLLDLISFHLNQLIARRGRPGGVHTVASYERSLVLALSNYLEVTLWFSAWYAMAHRGGYLDITSSPLVLSIFRESLAMMLVNTTGFFTPKPSWPLWIAMCLQSVVGLFLTIVVLARTLSLLPMPKEDQPPSDPESSGSAR